MFPEGRGRRGALLLLGAVLASACAGEPDGITSRALRYDGCEAVLEGLTCALPESGEIAVWVEGEEGSLLALADDRELPCEGELRADGVLCELNVPAGTRRLELKVEDAGVVSSVTAFGLRPFEPEPPLLKEARALKGAGRLEEARALLWEHTDPMEPRFEGVALGLLARVERALGDAEGAEMAYRRAIALHGAAGNLSAEVNDRTALVYVLIQNGRRFSEAREVLKPVARSLPHHGTSAYLLDYYQGLLARKTENHRAALELLGSAAREARRMNRPVRASYAEQVLAHSYSRTGRFKEAEALFEGGLKELPPGKDECARMFLLLNYGWELLLHREAQGTGAAPASAESSRSPRGLFLEALLLAKNSCTAYPAEERNLLLNLALSSLEEGDLSGAGSYLRQTRALATGGTVLQVLWAHDLEGRLALETGAFLEAREHYRKLGDLARSVDHPTGRWRGLLGTALALGKLGETTRAHSYFAKAEALLERESLLVPVHGGRDLFLARHEHATVAYIDSLLAMGLHAEAFEAVRRTRSRYLRGMLVRHRLLALDPTDRVRWDLAMGRYKAARAAWSRGAEGLWALPADEVPRAEARQREQSARARNALDAALAVVGEERRTLPLRSPLPGQLFLGFYQGADGWTGFARSADALVVEPLGVASLGERTPGELTELLLKPFSDQITAHREVVVFSWGASRGVDFHALPFLGAPLIESVAVVYSLDLPPREARFEDPAPGQRSALVVVDPRGDLPQARLEGEAVLRGLREEGLSAEVRALRGAEASAAAVVRELSEARSFHYAGHGMRPASDPFGAALLLADEDQLEVGDILALARVPQWVVLTACEAAKSREEATMETIGVAQAFLVGGARAVVAATRPIADDLGAALSAALGSAGEGLKSDHFRVAQRRLLRDRPDADWAGFRLMVP